MGDAPVPGVDDDDDMENDEDAKTPEPNDGLSPRTRARNRVADVIAKINNIVPPENWKPEPEPEPPKPQPQLKVMPQAIGGYYARVITEEDEKKEKSKSRSRSRSRSRRRRRSKSRSRNRSRRSRSRRSRSRRRKSRLEADQEEENVAGREEGVGLSPGTERDRRAKRGAGGLRAKKGARDPKAEKE